jgi:tryptophan 2,3-dioxygenase
MPEPIYHNEKLTYGSYLKIEQLLSLQKELSRPAHHDELLFITSHQVYELWFKQMIHELRTVCELVDHDEPLRAAQIFERLHRIQHLLIEQIPVLETMFAVEFAKFRDNLRPASGFQSVQFRKIEFLCGTKNPKMINLAGDDDRIRAELDSALCEPTVYDHLLRFLSRPAGGGLAIPRVVLGRDTSLPHEPSEELARAILPVYHNPEVHYPQFRLCEQYLEFDERFALWRFHHVKMVERMIGSKTGTGGSSGAKYLMATVDRRFFPELWILRANIGGDYGEATRGPG